MTEENLVFSDESDVIDAVAEKPAPRKRASAAKAVVSDAPVAVAESVAKADERVWITLEDNKGIPPRGQFFGINGAGYILKPGKKAYVPKGIVDILDNALQQVPTTNPDTLQIDGWTEQLRFPYRIHPNG